MSNTTHQPKTLDLTIRATSGATWDTQDFTDRDIVAHVASKATKHFVRKGEMAEGDYALAETRHGESRLLDDASTLGDEGIHKHDTLALVPRAPQVDG